MFFQFQLTDQKGLIVGTPTLQKSLSCPWAAHSQHLGSNTEVTIGAINMSPCSQKNCCYRFPNLLCQTRTHHDMKTKEKWRTGMASADKPLVTGRKADLSVKDCSRPWADFPAWAKVFVERIDPVILCIQESNYLWESVPSLMPKTTSRRTLLLDLNQSWIVELIKWETYTAEPTGYC